MKNYATSLQAKILAININNQHSELILNFETEQLSKFIGENILKVDGSFKAKINHKKIKIEREKINVYGFDFWVNTDYYFTSSYGKLSINVKTNISGGGSDRNGMNNHCIYETSIIDLFSIDAKGILKPLEKQYFVNSQYNEIDILNAEKEVKAAAEAYKLVLDKMPNEFRYITNCERLTR